MDCAKATSQHFNNYLEATNLSDSYTANCGLGQSKIYTNQDRTFKPSAIDITLIQCVNSVNYTGAVGIADGPLAE